MTVDTPNDLSSLVKERCPEHERRFLSGLNTFLTLLDYGHEKIKQLVYHLGGPFALVNDFKNLNILFNDSLISTSSTDVSNVANITKQCISLRFVPALIEAINSCQNETKIEVEAILKRSGYKKEEAPPPPQQVVGTMIYGIPLPSSNPKPQQQGPPTPKKKQKGMGFKP